MHLDGDAPARLSVQLIGPLVVRRDGVLLDPRLGGPKPRQVFEILLLRRGAAASKDLLIELLWGDRAPREARATLETYVCILRRHLQPALGKSGPLRTTTGGYMLDADVVDTDLARFDALLTAARRAHVADAYPTVVEALALATGPLLGDELRLPWVDVERESHAAAVTAARVLAADAACVLGQHEAAIRWAEAALDADPLHEGAWAALILALERSGRCAEGLRAYERCRRTLERELGCEPGPALRAAHARLLRATADGAGELSSAISALLVLNDRLEHPQPGFDEPASSRADDAVRRAEEVLTAFLRRATRAA